MLSDTDTDKPDRQGNRGRKHTPARQETRTHTARMTSSTSPNLQTSDGVIEPCYWFRQSCARSLHERNKCSYFSLFFGGGQTWSFLIICRGSKLVISDFSGVKLGLFFIISRGYNSQFLLFLGGQTQLYFYISRGSNLVIFNYLSGVKLGHF